MTHYLELKLTEWTEILMTVAWILVHQENWVNTSCYGLFVLVQVVLFPSVYLCDKSDLLPADLVSFTQTTIHPLIFFCLWGEQKVSDGRWENSSATINADNKRSLSVCLYACCAHAEVFHPLPFSLSCWGWRLSCSYGVTDFPQCPWCGWGAWSRPPWEGW